MPKINVYLPDELAEAVRETGLSVSPICQRALEQAVRRITTIRQAVLGDIDPDRLAQHLPAFTTRLVSVLTLAVERARATGAATITTGDLLHGLLTEGHNLGLQVLTAMEVAPGSLTAPDTPEPAAAGALRFSGPAAVTLELSVSEAIGFGHNYVGCEHLLVGLAGEPDGAAGALLRSRAVDGKAARRAVAAAVAGYDHFRASTGQATATAMLSAVRAELAPLLERVERLERHLP